MTTRLVHPGLPWSTLTRKGGPALALVPQGLRAWSTLVYPVSCVYAHVGACARTRVYAWTP